ncbi:p87 vp80 [Trichonephila clavipes]|nr:p87 vp80 [Trichonephila clavipes]
MTQVFELLKLGNDTFPYKVVPIDGDGSCLFSSISYLLYGNVQSSFVDYIISNWDRFKVFTHDHQGNYPTREAYKIAMLNPMTYGSASELQAASKVFSCRFQIFRNGHLFAVFGEHFETVKNIRFSGKNLSAGHFDAYVFSSNNEEWEIFESNIQVAGKQRQVNPKMPPKRKRSVRYRTHKVKENMKRKRGNEAPLKQESRRESNRLRMARLRALETVQEQESLIVYKFKEGSLKVLKIKKRDLNAREMSYTLQKWPFGKIKKMLPIPTIHQ